MYELFGPFPFIIIGIFLTLLIIFIVGSINNPDRTYFGYAIVPCKTITILPPVCAYAIVIEGSKTMKYGDYHMFFELADKSDIFLVDIEGNIHKNWITQSFTKADRKHGYYLAGCPEGKNLLTVKIVSNEIQRTLYIPFDVKADDHENLPCQEC